METGSAPNLTVATLTLLGASSATGVTLTSQAVVVVGAIEEMVNYLLISCFNVSILK